MNDVLLQDKVRDSGYKWSHICHILGISASALNKKRKGKIPWRVCDINALTELLSLSVTERDDIFDLRSPK